MQFRDAAHADDIGAIGEEELERSKLHASSVTVIPRGAEIESVSPKKSNTIALTHTSKNNGL